MPPRTLCSVSKEACNVNSTNYWICLATTALCQRAVNAEDKLLRDSREQTEFGYGRPLAAYWHFG